MYQVRRWRNKTGVSREEVIMRLFGRGGKVCWVIAVFMAFIISW